VTPDPHTEPEPAVRSRPVPILIVDADEERLEADPGVVVRTCANCGAPMDERKCKLICRCGYFLSCSDYY
jgi:hypothetical protein